MQNKGDSLSTSTSVFLPPSLSLSLAVATDRLRWGTCHTVRSSCTATYNESAKPNVLDLK